MNNRDVFLRECDKINNNDIKRFVIEAINNLPDYFFTMAASTSGKYHPSYALGDGGLMRHTIAAVKFALHLLELEQFQEQFSEVERDCIVAAVLLHDGWKRGAGSSIHSVHEHPQVSADWIRSSEVLDGILPNEQRDLIASCVETHMGQWNVTKKSKVELKKPSSNIQNFVHLCDYLASRKDVEVLFDADVNETLPKIEDFVMPFGKYKEKLLVDIAKSDIGYLAWLKANTQLKNPLKGFINELLEGAK